MTPDGPNAKQIEYWNEQAGPAWVEAKSYIDSLVEPIGLAAMERAAPAPGEDVLDVGCGTGQATLELARRVAPTGSVTAMRSSMRR